MNERGDLAVVPKSRVGFVLLFARACRRIYLVLVFSPVGGTSVESRFERRLLNFFLIRVGMRMVGCARHCPFAIDCGLRIKCHVHLS